LPIRQATGEKLLDALQSSNLLADVGQVLVRGLPQGSEKSVHESLHG